MKIFLAIILLSASSVFAQKEFKKYTFLKPNDFFRKVIHSNDQNIIVIWQ